MTADGLRPGQSWAIAPGGAWQARIGRDGRCHVIGRELAKHPEHGPMYRERLRYARRKIANGRIVEYRPRRWRIGAVGFELACRAARMHERMVIAAKRNAAQAGQGEG